MADLAERRADVAPRAAYPEPISNTFLAVRLSSRSPASTRLAQRTEPS